MHEYCTVAQIAEELGLNRETVRRWIRFHGLKAERVGSRKSGFIIDREDLTQFLAEKRPPDLTRVKRRVFDKLTEEHLAEAVERIDDATDICKDIMRDIIREELREEIRQIVRDELAELVAGIIRGS